MPQGFISSCIFVEELKFAYQIVKIRSNLQDSESRTIRISLHRARFALLAKVHNTLENCAEQSSNQKRGRNRLKLVFSFIYPE